MSILKKRSQELRGLTLSETQTDLASHINLEQLDKEEIIFPGFTDTSIIINIICIASTYSTPSSAPGVVQNIHGCD